VPTSIRRFGILPSPAVETAKSSGRKAKSVFWQGRTQDLQVPAKKMAFLKSKYCEVQIFLILYRLDLLRRAIIII
jgi:hypothetical protein